MILFLVIAAAIASAIAFLTGVWVGGAIQRAAHEAELRNRLVATGHNVADLFRKSEGT